MRKKTILKIVKIALPLLVGVFLMWYSLSSQSSEERSEMWQAIQSVNPFWIVISLIFALLSHLSRAYRWNFMLEPLGYTPRILNNFMAVMIAYFANTFVMRSGEILRGVSISTAEEIPFEKAFGTIISERIADLIMLLLIMLAAILLQTEALIAYFGQYGNPLFLLGALIIAIAAGIFGLKILQTSSNPLVLKIRTFGLGLLEGIQSIFKMKRPGAFLFHTLFIWGMYVGMFWIMKFTVAGTEAAPLGVILAAFVIGAFSMSATNAGMGLYPVAMGAIFSFFGFEGGITFGWILWGTQTLFNVVVGGLAALLMPVYNKNRKK